MSDFKSFLAPYIHEYKTWCEYNGIWTIEKNVKIKNFDKYCFNHHPKEIALSQESVDEWAKKRETEQFNSCRTRVSILRTFLIFTNDRGYTNVILPELPKKQRRKYIPHAFTEQELQEFFYHTDHMSVSKGNIDSAIKAMTYPVYFRLLYSSGLRTCEARWLKVKDVDLENGIVNIRKTKCNIEHYVVLHESMLEIMRIYDHSISRLIPNRVYFFSKSDGISHISRAMVNKYFRSFWGKVSSEYANPYALRHNYAIENINSWVGDQYDFFDKLVYLSKSMGHMDLESTKYYYSLVPGLADIIQARSNKSFDELVPEVDYGEN